MTGMTQHPAVPYPQGVPVPVVSSLPVAPYDGQEVYYLADDTAGVVWHLRYRSGSASSYKWEFVGGPPLESENATMSSPDSVTSASYTLIGGASITVPLAGGYDIFFTCRMDSAGAGYQAAATVKLGSAAAADTEAIFHRTDNFSSLARNFRRTLAANDALTIYGKYIGQSAARFFERALVVTPVRVG